MNDKNSSGPVRRWWHDVEDSDQYNQTASWLYSTTGQTVMVLVVVAVVVMLVLNLFGVA